MQLILNSETDIGINTKMSVIEQENLTETFKEKSVTSDLDIEFPNINEKTVKENDLESGRQEEDMETENPTESNDTEKLPNEIGSNSNVDKDLIECINPTNQCQNDHTTNKDSEEIEKMDVEKLEDIKNVEEKCEDIEMTDLQAGNIESSSDQLNKECNEAVEEIDKIVGEDINKNKGDILQESSAVVSVPLETEPQSPKTNTDDLKSDSDVLNLDFDDQKRESDEPKTNSDELKLDLDDTKPNSDEPKSDSDEPKLDFNGSKPNSDEPKTDSDDLKLNFDDSKLNSIDTNLGIADLKADSEHKIQDSDNLKLDTVDSNLNLKTDFDHQKPDSDSLKSGSNDLASDSDMLKPDSTEIKPDSEVPESDSINIKLDSDDPKSDSTNVKLNSGDLKPDSDEPKMDSNHVKSDSSCNTEAIKETNVGDIPNEKEESKTIDSINVSEESVKSVEGEKSKECADSESVQEKDETDRKAEEVNQINNQSSTENIIIENNRKISDTVVQEAIATTEIIDKNDKEEIQNNQSTTKIDPKKLSHICKLSNTLDILSDDEEESSKNKEEFQSKETSEKQCIQIEDDDDIMLIDEDNTASKVENNNHEVKESSESAPVTNEVNQTIDDSNKELLKEKDTLETKDEDTKTKADLIEQKQEEKPTDVPKTPKSLLSVTFLKTCKKNLADMTREELEEFCILKIVESVVDRSNLSEIKTQLKVMSQNIEEHKKKAFMLTKQNRDLQVVLKSVQEEQKKKTDLPITPLKITRSVGMQVFMTDKTVARRKSALGSNTISNTVSGNSPANKQIKSHINQSPKTPKNQANANNTQQIPVPKLVPASHLNNNKVQIPSSNVPAKSPATAATPNGVRNSPPVQKPVKRPLSKAGNSVTVDLTDDEPPSKLVQLNVNPPVRLVPPQNLLAQQRQPFIPTINSPRKVYIPISGSQNQVRPGQTIMLRPVGPQGPRQRGILPKQHANPMRMNSLIPSRHPAPLPDCMKQYQPPNWKSLPPAPELKLSKVENGIVISWKIDGYQEDNHEEIASYQLYAYQETSSPPSTTLWKKIGDVKALPLPMACTLTQFMAGYKYYFAVRAVDIRSRLGPFSAPGSILLLNKM